MSSYNDAYSRRGDEDRYRPRDRVRDHRDREHDRDRGRNRSRDPDRSGDLSRDPPNDASRPRAPPTGPRSNKLARTEAPTAEQASTSANKMSSGANAKLEDCIRYCMEAAQKMAKLDVKLESGRVYRTQKKMELDKSATKSAEYPSVAELQKKHRDRHDKQLGELEKARKVQTVEFEKAIAGFAACLVRALPQDIESLVDRRVQEASLKAKAASVDESLTATVSELRNGVKQAHENQRTLKADLAREKQDTETKLAAEIEKKISDRFQHVFSNQQKTIDGLVEGSKRLLDQLTTLQQEKKTTTAPTTSDPDLENVKEQIAQLDSRYKIDKETQQGNNRSLHGEVSKLRLENGRQQKDIETLQKVAARRDELAKVKAENDTLSTLMTDTKVQTRDLSTQFREYSQMSMAHDASISALDAARHEHEAGISRLDVLTREHSDAISRLDGLTKEHQHDLSRLDMTVLERVAEGWDIEWPNVLSSVQAVQDVKRRLERLEKLKQDDERVGDLAPVGSTGDRVSRQGTVASPADNQAPAGQDVMSRVMAAEGKARDAEKLATSVNTFTTQALAQIGRTMDGISRRVKATETRLAELPVTASPRQQQDAALKITVDTMVEKLNKTPAQLEAVNGRIDSIADRIEQLETSSKEISRQPTPQQSLLHLDPEVTKFRTKVEKFEGDFQRLSSEVKGVSDHFEMLNFQVSNLNGQYNNISTRPLAEHILAQMELVYPKNREVLDSMKNLQQRVAGVEQESRELRKRIDKAMRQQSTPDSVPGQPPQKRRRVEEDAHDSPRQSVGAGERPASSSPLAREG